MLSHSGTRADVSVTAEGEGRAVEVTPPGRLARLVGIARIACGAALFGPVAVAAAESWHEVRSALAQVNGLQLVLAEALVVAGLGTSVLTWRRVLVELGQTVSVGTAARIYLIGQLGKYIPGSVWAFAAQGELGRSAGISRARGTTASVIAAGVNVATGLLLGAGLASRVSAGGAVNAALVLALVVVLAGGLTPPVLARLVAAVLHAARRPPLAGSISWRGIGTAGAWSIGTWLSYGISVWVLAIAVGAPAGEALPLCLAGVPLAIAAGVLVFIAPSGIAVREAVIVAALAPVLSHADALAVALVARFLFTVGDLLTAVAVLRVRPRPSVEA